MSENGNKKKKRRINYKVFVTFIIFEIIFTIMTGPLFIFYGPFQTLKKMFVGMSISSFKHQYIAQAFLNDEQIGEILNGDNGEQSTDLTPISNNSSHEDLNKIKIQSHDNTIECQKVDARKFDGYMLIVHDPTRVKVGYTQKLGVQGEKTSQIAKEYNAVAAINGGGFTDKSQNSKAIWTGTGAYPDGIVMVDKKIIYPQNVDTKKEIDGCVVGINKRGLLMVGNYSIDDLKNNDVTDALVFGPPLILNGVPQTKDKYGYSIDSQGTAPRTAIGQRKDGAILMLVADGRQGLKAGATLKDIQNIMMQEDAYNAVNLDGGASSTLYYDGHVINSPSDKFGERPIPTIFYVKE